MRRRAQRHFKRYEPAPPTGEPAGDHPVLVLIDRLVIRVDTLEKELARIDRLTKRVEKHLVGLDRLASRVAALENDLKRHTH